MSDYLNGREVVTFYDPITNRPYAFDVAFMLSTYNCTWGRGCHGMTHVPEYGCCIKGVTLNGVAELNRVAKFVDQLTPELWANHQRYHFDQEWKTDGDIDADEAPHNTAVLNGVCIFHNPEESDAPTGCALHHLAVESDLDPDDTRPNACSIYPIEGAWDEETQTTTFQPIRRQGENCMAEEADSWWCIDDPTNYDVNNEVFYLTYWTTLIRNSSEAVMLMFHEWAQERLTSTPVDYGHPANAGDDMNKWGLFSTVPVTLTRKAQ